MISPDPDELEPVFRSRQPAACHERSLVLHAVGIRHAVLDTDEGCVLLVAPADAQRARDQLTLYTRENRGWPPKLPEYARRTDGIAGIAAYVAVLLAVSGFDTRDAFGFDWRGAGRMAAGPVLDGEWWRTVTALTLHLDHGHLAGNLVIGALFGLLASHLLGAGLAWTSILLAGALGNLINAWVQPAWHQAVGASTAVFAALGLLTAYLWKEREVLGHRGAFLWAPVVAGAVLLTWFGTGGERTDVTAHLTGFVAGALPGWWFAGAGARWIPGLRGQRIAGAAGAIVLLGTWWIALTAG